MVLWNQPDDFLAELQATRQNKYLKLDPAIIITDNLDQALKDSQAVFIAVKAQHFRDLCQELLKHQPQNKLFILAMKGLEQASGQRLSQIFREYFPNSNHLGVLAGPGHPQEISQNIPTAMVCSSDSPDDLTEVADCCQTRLIKIFPNSDFLGVEIGAALKNVVGLAAGLLSALGLKSFKSYLLARGPVEVGNLIFAMGGQRRTAFGLAHLGDYGATVFSGLSHNHQAGELWVKQRQLATDAEGLPTVKAVKILMEKYKVAMPICQAVDEVFYQGLAPEKFVETLLKIKTEFE